MAVKSSLRVFTLNTKRQSRGFSRLILKKGLVARKIWVPAGTGPTGQYHAGYNKTIVVEEGEKEHVPLSEDKFSRTEKIGREDVKVGRGHHAVIYMQEDDYRKFLNNTSGKRFNTRVEAALDLANYKAPKDVTKTFKDPDTGRKYKKVVEKSILTQEDIGVPKADILSAEVQKALIADTVSLADMVNSFEAKRSESDRKSIYYRQRALRAKSLADMVATKDTNKRDIAAMYAWRLDQAVRNSVDDDKKKYIPDWLGPFDETVEKEVKRVATGDYFQNITKLAKGELVVPNFSPEPISGESEYDRERRIKRANEQMGKPVSSADRAAYKAMGIPVSPGATYVTKPEWDMMLAEVMGARQEFVDAKGNKVLASLDIPGSIEGLEKTKFREVMRLYWGKGAFEGIQAAALHFQRNGQYRVGKDEIERLVGAGITGAIEALTKYRPTGEMNDQSLDPRSPEAVLNYVSRNVMDHTETEALNITGEAKGDWYQATLSLKDTYGTNFKRFKRLAHGVNKAIQAEISTGTLQGRWPSPETLRASLLEDFSESNVDAILSDKQAIQAFHNGDTGPWELWLDKRMAPKAQIVGEAAGTEEVKTEDVSLPSNIYQDIRLMGAIEGGGTPPTMGSVGPMNQERIKRGWTAQLDKHGIAVPGTERWTGDPEDFARVKVSTITPLHPSHLISLQTSSAVRSELFSSIADRNYRSNQNDFNSGILEAIDVALFPGLPLKSGAYEVNNQARKSLQRQISEQKERLGGIPDTHTKAEEYLRNNGRDVTTASTEIALQTALQMKRGITKTIQSLEKRLRSAEASPDIKVPAVDSLYKATVGGQNFPAFPKRFDGSDDMARVKPVMKEAGIRNAKSLALRAAWHMCLRDALQSPVYSSDIVGASTRDLKENGNTVDMGPLGPLFPEQLEGYALLKPNLAGSLKEVKRRFNVARHGQDFTSTMAEEVARRHIRDPEKAQERVFELKHSEFVQNVRRLGRSSPQVHPKSKTGQPEKHVSDRFTIAQKGGVDDAGWRTPLVFNNEKAQYGTTSDKMFPYDDLHSLVKPENLRQWYDGINKTLKYLHSTYFAEGSEKELRTVKTVRELERGKVPSGKVSDNPWSDEAWVSGEGDPSIVFPRKQKVPRRQRIVEVEGENGPTREVVMHDSDEYRRWQQKQRSAVGARAKVLTQEKRRRLVGTALEEGIATAEAREEGKRIFKRQMEVGRSRSPKHLSETTEGHPYEEYIGDDPLLMSRAAGQVIAILDTAVKSPSGRSAQSALGSNTEVRSVFVDIQRTSTVVTTKGGKRVLKTTATPSEKVGQKPRKQSVVERILPKTKAEVGRTVSSEQNPMTENQPPPSRQVVTPPEVSRRQAIAFVTGHPILSIHPAGKGRRVGGALSFQIRGGVEKEK